jgi:RNA polymerase I-specific transcription initiation factor RRN5
MNSSADSSIADPQDDDSHAIVEPSGSSSEFVEQSDTSSNESKLSNRNRTFRARQNQQDIQSQKEHTVHRGKKGNSSRKHYSDHYLELFKATVADFENGGDGVPSVELLPTQLGAVQWQPSEKDRLFNALSRKGRLQEAAVAEVVGKSELEVRDYLMFLRNREAERHLFEKQTKQVSHAEIPAAVEISQECETALEQAADALAIFQNQYDTAVAEKQYPGMWLIDWNTAGALDEQVLDAEEAGSDSEELAILETVPGEGLFRLSYWLELSERIFMNPGPPRLHNNWHNIATEDERPALTREALSDFYDLTLSITRRLIQTCMFLAESRMRSTKGQGYNPKPLVKEQDVMAALEVLGMASSLSDTLLGVARRNSLQVIRGSHDKGSGRSQVLTFDEVEREILKRKKSKHGRRSASTTSRSSGTSASVEGVVPEPRHLTAGRIANDQASRDASPSLISIQDAEADISMSDASVSSIEADVQDSQGDEYGGLSFHSSTSRQKRRQIHLESQQDAYMEELDRLKSEEDENHLWQILGRSPPTKTKRELDKDLGIRPKTLRKTKEDLADWQGAFAAEWEVFGEMIAEQSFVETGRRAKRPRLQDESHQEQRDVDSNDSRSLPVRPAGSGSDGRDDLGETGRPGTGTRTGLGVVSAF